MSQNDLLCKDEVLNLQNAQSRESYWEKRLQENWGLHGVGHISYGIHYNRWLYKVRRHVFAREVRRMPIDWGNANVLDIGSGTGFWIKTWNTTGVRSVTGSDITDTAVEKLRGYYPHSQVLKLDISGSLEEQTVTGKYEVISAFDVLFHIVDDARFYASLANISSLLTDGGYFIFSDNFLHGIGVRADNQVNRSIREISSALANVGFRVVRRVPMFVAMNTPIDTIRQWPRSLWRAVMLPVHLAPFLGFVYGAVFYPFEICATRLLKESPTTEMMICQKTTIA